MSFFLYCFTSIVAQEISAKEIDRSSLRNTELVFKQAQNQFKQQNYERSIFLSKSALELCKFPLSNLFLYSSLVDLFKQSTICYVHFLIQHHEKALAKEILHRAILEPYIQKNKVKNNALFLLWEENFSTSPPSASCPYLMNQNSINEVHDIRNFMRDGEKYESSRLFKLAIQSYHKILKIDKYNSQTDKHIINLNHQKEEIANLDYEKRRHELLSDIDKEWQSIPKKKISITHNSENLNENQNDTIEKKLRKIIIPHLSLHGETIAEALEIIQQKSIDYDFESPSNEKGVNIIAKTASNQTSDHCLQINVCLNHISLLNIIKYLAYISNMSVQIEPYTVVLLPISDTKEILLTKEYKISQDFIYFLINSMDINNNNQNILTNKIQVVQPTMKECLENQGIPFPTNSIAAYIPSNSTLLVKNTAENLDTLEKLILSLHSINPTQVEIEARFLEVTQNNLNSQGFDWLLGSFQLPGRTGISASGGNIGNQISNQGNYPFTSTDQLPIGSLLGMPSTGNISAGNRTTGRTVGINALDALLLGSGVGVAPGILALAGVFSNPQFQVVLRALNAKQGIDLVSSPKITVSSGHHATINITRQFPYPHDYSPPQVPQSQGGISPVTPSTPTSFSQRKIGIELEVEPIIQSDNIIFLNLAPQITEFAGFVNYGTPITTIANDKTIGNINLTSTREVELTPNRIEQPIFSVRQVDTHIAINSGQTIMLGGFMREEIETIHDKIPILGDIPIINPLFKSSSKRRVKKNLLIFVTVKLRDISGNKINHQKS